MSRTLKLVLPLVVLVAVGVYLAGSFAGASENDPPPREPVVLPSQSTTPSTGSSPSTDPSGVPVVTPGPVDDDDDDDDRDDRHDDD
ncbi:hypothetical protein ACIA03_24810 [Nocardioides sp. NPDC051685]|uniref:small secreted hydrophilic protein n=1 Tax=Nocardioides sp. NPDC051685 TaxID=3364334 RepID=UPI0011547446